MASYPLQSLALSVIVVGVYGGLMWLLPTPVDSDNLATRGGLHILRYNIENFWSMKVTYPPLLFHGTLLLLSVIGLRSGNVFCGSPHCSRSP